MLKEWLEMKWHGNHQEIFLSRKGWQLASGTNPLKGTSLCSGIILCIYRMHMYNRRMYAEMAIKTWHSTRWTWFCRTCSTRADEYPVHKTAMADAVHACLHSQNRCKACVLSAYHTLCAASSIRCSLLLGRRARQRELGQGAIMNEEVMLWIRRNVLDLHAIGSGGSNDGRIWLNTMQREGYPAYCLPLYARLAGKPHIVGSSKDWGLLWPSMLMIGRGLGVGTLSLVSCSHCNPDCHRPGEGDICQMARKS